MNWNPITFKEDGTPVYHKERFYLPEQIKEPQEILVGDIFHENVLSEMDTFEALQVMARADWHEYTVVTKFSERMEKHFANRDFWGRKNARETTFGHVIFKVAENAKA